MYRDPKSCQLTHHRPRQRAFGRISMKAYQKLDVEFFNGLLATDYGGFQISLLKRLYDSCLLRTVPCGT